jgi:hypothetical protein
MVVIAAHSFSRWSPLKTLQSRNHVHHNHIYYLTSPPMSRDWLTRLDFNTLALPRPGQRRLYRGTSTNSLQQKSHVETLYIRRFLFRPYIRQQAAF